MDHFIRMGFRIGLRLVALTGLLLGMLLSINTPAAEALDILEFKLVAGDTVDSDFFGYSVAISGDTAVVGAYLDDDHGFQSGSAYIFIQSSTGWIQEAKLTADDGSPIDCFGLSVAISGDTVVVGAPYDDDNGSDSGSAYVYTRNDGVWSKQAKLNASDGAAYDYFGRTVSISGDAAIIGAYMNDALGVDSGSAYIFARSEGGWLEQAKLTADDGAAYDDFGWSVAISGDTAAVGANRDDILSRPDAGSVYVFTRAGEVWSQQAKLTASDSWSNEFFGLSVAISGNQLAVSSVKNSGAVYIFSRLGGAWSQQAKLNASDQAGVDKFGQSISISEDTVVVGAPEDYHDGFYYSGSAYIFNFSNGTWVEQTKLIASDTAEGDRFGISVSISGSTVAVGSYMDDDQGMDSGSAYIYDLVSNNPPVADAGGPYLGAVNTSITFEGSLSSDPENDPLTYMWFFGDGSTGTGVMPTHSYMLAGIYDVCLTVNDGKVDSLPSCNIVVIYDPEGGFVTGGGWYDSPVGAYKPDESLTGKATFGFVSKYKKGVSVPIGNTEFQFQAGGFNFHSNAYEWLVISGARAQFKGQGTINDGLDPNGNPYKFMLWAGDGSPDTFRIKIWSEYDGIETVIYDNGINQAISGSIIIHKK